MIEQAHNLLECEAILSKQVAAISLLGQIDLTQGDLEVLTRLILKETAKGLPRVIHNLEKYAPTCLACFLVAMGTYGYQKHSYWSPVLQVLDLGPDPASEQLLGSAFLRYLERHKLPRFEILGSLKFVTPILLHGGIPDACLSEYFEELLLPLVTRDGIDPSDPVEIAQELAIRRESEWKRGELDAEHKTLTNQVAHRKKNARTLRQAAEILDDYSDLRQLETRIQVHLIPDDFPEDYLSYRAHALEEIERCESELGSLVQETERLRQEPQLVSEQDQRVLSLASDIEKCIHGFPRLKHEAEQLDQLKAEEAEASDRLRSLAARVLSQPWNDDHCKVLQDLPSAELANDLEQLAIAEGEYSRVQVLEQENALVPRENSRWVAPVVALSTGTGLLAVGLLRSSAVMILPSVALSAAGVWLIWNRYRQGVERNRRSVDIAQQLRAVEENVTRLRNRVDETLSQLQIQERYLASPTHRLLQDLSDLAAGCAQIAALRSQRADLEQSVLPRRSFLERAIECVGLPPSPNMDGSVDLLAQTLEDARRRHAEASQANEDLRADLQSRKTLVEEKIDSLKADLAHKEALLVNLAKGQEIGRALRDIETVRQEQRAAAARRRELEQQHPNLADLEPVLERAIGQDRNKHDLISMAEAVSKQAWQLQGEAEGIAAKLERFPSVFPGIDEPIRRYILYGGDSAEQFLIDSLWLICQARSTAEGADYRDSVLSDRVKIAFEAWWLDWNERALANLEMSEPSDASDGSQLRKPYLVFDSGAGEIVVTLPAQHIPAIQDSSSDEVEIVLESAVPSERSGTSTLPLRVYKLSQDLYETEMIELPVSVPSSEYHFSLSRNGQTIRHWVVPGLAGDPLWLAFDWQRNRGLVQEVPAGKVWLLTKKGIKVKRKQRIIEEVPLFGQWRDYVVRGLDLAGADSLELVGEDGTVGHVPISVDMRGDPEVNATEQVHQVFSNGMQVFSALPELTVPGCYADELAQWRLSILPTGEGEVREPKHFRLSDLPEDALWFHPAGDVVRVSLDNQALLGSEAFGAYELRVRKSPHQPWTTFLAVIPSLSVEFARPLYSPSEGGLQTPVSAEVSLDQSLSFEPVPPAMLIENDRGIHRIETRLGEDGIKGLIEFRSTFDRSMRLPVSISVPKLRWRLEGAPGSSLAGWSSDIREIWLGDWASATELSLVVSLPSTVAGTVRLGLNPAGTESQVRTLRQGKARFDLLAFGDALRRGSAVQAMVLTADNPELLLHNTELLRVRTRWEAQEIECIQEVRERTVVLTVSWIEQGQTDGKQRMVRLWRASVNPMDMVLETIVTDENCAVLQGNVHMLRPGRYLLEVILVDPWSTTTPSPPRYKSPGTQLIEIASQGDIRQGERFLIRSIMDDQGRVLSLANKSYRIQIIGKIVNRTLPPGAETTDVLVTRTNEGWYVGDLEVEGAPELAACLQTTNPVKFQYVAATDQLSAVEDRYGEGAMYCADCRCMFWSQETNLKEGRAGHTLIGPLEVFKITWESQ